MNRSRLFPQIAKWNSKNKVKDENKTLIAVIGFIGDHILCTKETSESGLLYVR